MNTSFLKIFSIITMLSLLLLVAGEWLINKNIEMSHVIGWLFVATFIGALIGVSRQKSSH